MKLLHKADLPEPFTALTFQVVDDSAAVMVKKRAVLGAAATLSAAKIMAMVAHPQRANEIKSLMPIPWAPIE
jgi:hypothetical protein